MSKIDTLNKRLESHKNIVGPPLPSWFYELVKHTPTKEEYLATKRNGLVKAINFTEPAETDQWLSIYKALHKMEY